LSLVALGVASPVLAQQAQPDLADLSLEELANLQVTSVSRRAERLSDAAASIFAITGDDIRRSGVTSLPEALRLAPNLQVARVDARQYAISARGFNSTTANKLLVLIDGRTVYTPLFSGVFWDAQDVFLEDVARIEVISGPGATLWGANAVNGVINVITRPAAETKGLLAYAAGGNRESGIGVRYGTDLPGGALRIYGKGSDRDNTVRANGTDVPDGWQNVQGGFRADWGTAANGFTLQGDAYRGTIDQLAPGDVRISGGNLLARWSRQLASGGHLQFQAYFDQTEREIPGTFIERLDTYDLEFQHSFHAASGHHLTWGGGYRSARDRVYQFPRPRVPPGERNPALVESVHPGRDRTERAAALHCRDQGSQQSVHRLGVLPSARLAWKPIASQTVWDALSRAVRAPARLDRELVHPGAAAVPARGRPDFRSEIANVLELGYRAQPSPRLSYSLTAFHAAYDRSAQPRADRGSARS
jgi:iron complex outermembrane receptor protein